MSTLPLRQQLVNIASSKVGVREVPVNSNTGPDVKMFQQASWLAGTGWAWCAAFVDWCILKWGQSPDVLRALGKTPSKFEAWRPKTAGAWDFENWAAKADVQFFTGRILKDLVLHTGDILVFQISHIGIIATDTDGGTVIHTIEGNTDASGGREGGGVYARTRTRPEIRSIIRLLP